MIFDTFFSIALGFGFWWQRLVTAENQVNVVDFVAKKFRMSKKKNKTYDTNWQRWRENQKKKSIWTKKKQQQWIDEGMTRDEEKPAHMCQQTQTDTIHCTV